MQRFVLLVMTAIATVLFQLGKHVPPTWSGYGAAHMAFSVEHSALHA